MSTGAIVAIVVAIIVVAALIIALMAARRRSRLQQRFGPEYDRVVGEHDSKRKAEAELADREKRVQDLEIHPLTPAARASYADRWAAIQERFVDMPTDAVAESQVLVVAVMTERGYPAEDHDQIVADLSVEHANTLDHYRAAEKISTTAGVGTASTEDLRQAMIHYRELFRELLGERADEETGPAGTGSVPDLAADETDESDPAENPELKSQQPESRELGSQEPESEVPAAGTRDPLVAGEPVADGQADIPVQRTPRS
jgi:hypothetical protein